MFLGLILLTNCSQDQLVYEDTHNGEKDVFLEFQVSGSSILEKSNDEINTSKNSRLSCEDHGNTGGVFKWEKGDRMLAVSTESVKNAGEHVTDKGTVLILDEFISANIAIFRGNLPQAGSDGKYYFFYLNKNLKITTAEDGSIRRTLTIQRQLPYAEPLDFP